MNKTTTTIIALFMLLVTIQAANAIAQELFDNNLDASEGIKQLTDNSFIYRTDTPERWKIVDQTGNVSANIAHICGNPIRQGIPLYNQPNKLITRCNNTAAIIYDFENNDTTIVRLSGNLVQTNTQPILDTQYYTIWTYGVAPNTPTTMITPESANTYLGSSEVTISTNITNNITTSGSFVPCTNQFGSVDGNFRCHAVYQIEGQNEAVYLTGYRVSAVKKGYLYKFAWNDSTLFVEDTQILIGNGWNSGTLGNTQWTWLSQNNEFSGRTQTGNSTRFIYDTDTETVTDFPYNNRTLSNGTTIEFSDTLRTNTMETSSIKGLNTFITTINDETVAEFTTPSLDANLIYYFGQIENTGQVYYTNATELWVVNDITIPATPPNGSNVTQTTTTYYNVTLHHNHTWTFPEETTNIRSLYLDKTEKNALMTLEYGGTDQAYIVNYTDTTNTEFILQKDLNDDGYSIDLNSNILFVSTDNEIQVFSGYDIKNLTQIASDGWGTIIPPHPDKVYDVVTTSNETGYVCDNHDEIDEYNITQDPYGGSDNGACYDLELDGEILYEDADDEGILIWNTSDWSTALSQFDNTTGHGLESGDLLDYQNQELLTTKTAQTYQYLNVSDPNNPVAITNCNFPAGTVTSVEIINRSLLLAGTSTGNLMICDGYNTNETENTQYKTLQVGGEPILSVEWDDPYIHITSTNYYQTYAISTEQTTVNTPPNITGYTLSSDTAGIGQSITGTIVAGNVEPEDVIWYAHKCNGTESSYSLRSTGDFTCTYTASGTYQVVAAITDNFHAGQYFDEQNLTVEVSEELYTGGWLRIQVIDEQQQAVAGALISADDQTATTSAEGTASIYPDDNGLYTVTTSKSGYYSSVDSFYADGTVHVVTLQLEGETNQTIFQVTVQNSNGSRIENALVSYTNIITYQYDFKFTNALGLAIFKDIDGGTVAVTASKDGFESTQKSVEIANNQTTATTLTLPLEGQAIPSNLHADRNCTDQGIWLCGQNNIRCTEDSDCLSTECNPGGFCSEFNYSWCDANGYARGQRCVIAASTGQGLGNTTSWFLTNFLYATIILIILIAIGLVVFTFRRK